MTHLSNYDFLFAGIVLVSALFAIIRGGVAEILSLSTWFIAILVMQRYADMLSHFIPDAINNSLLRSLIAYLIAFIGVAIIITIIKKIFNQLISKLGLGGLNYLLGAVFGVVRGLIVCALLIITLEIFNLDSQHGWRKSSFAPLLTPLVSMVVNAIPENIRHLNHEPGKS